MKGRQKQEKLETHTFEFIVYSALGAFPPPLPLFANEAHFLFLLNKM